MTLQSSGPLSMFQVNVELGLSSGAQISLLGSNVRGLFAIPTGAVNLLAGRGKSYLTTYSGTLTGSGSLSIPAGTTTVNLTGRGGMGGTTAGTDAVYDWDLTSRTDTFGSHTGNPSGTSGGPPTTTSAADPTGLGQTASSSWYTLYTAAVAEVQAVSAVYGWNLGSRSDTYEYETQVPFGANRTTAPTTTSASAPTSLGVTTTSYWYYESQAAVAAFAGSGYHAGTTGSPATYKWDTGTLSGWTWTDATLAGINALYNSYGHTAPTGACANGDSTSRALTEPVWTSAGGGYYYFNTTSFSSMVDQAAVDPVAAWWDDPPRDAVPAYYYQYSSVWPSYLVSAAVAYQAPVAAVYSQYSSSWPSYLVSAAVAGTPYAGASTTAILNGVTRTWVGGTGAVLGTESTQSLASTGAGQTMTYVVAGSLSYSYQGL